MLTSPSGLLRIASIKFRCAKRGIGKRYRIIATQNSDSTSRRCNALYENVLSLIRPDFVNSIHVRTRITREGLIFMNLQQRGTGSYTINSVSNAFRILSCFSDRNPELRLKDISEMTDMTPSAVSRSLATMREVGYIDQNPQTGAYRLSIRFVELAGIVLNSMEIRRRATPYLDELIERTGLTANLGVLDRGEVVYVARIESPDVIRRYFQIGKRNPVHCTALGKALMCDKSDEEIEAIIKERGMIRRTINTITDLDQFKECLGEARLRGYAVDYEELINGINCLAAPIRDLSGEIIAAISIVGHVSRCPADRILEYVPIILEISLRISQGQGYALA